MGTASSGSCFCPQASQPVTQTCSSHHRRDSLTFEWTIIWEWNSAATSGSVGFKRRLQVADAAESARGCLWTSVRVSSAGVYREFVLTEHNAGAE